MSGLWIVEYSELADKKGVYPWHVEPINRNHPSDAWSNSWRIVFTGSADEAFEKLEILVTEWEFKKQKRPVRQVKERNKMTPSLRYEILKRDNFKCQICGRTKDDGIKLHVDHIVPVSGGGRTVRENLRALCDKCNHGKASRSEV